MTTPRERANQRIANLEKDFKQMPVSKKRDPQVEALNKVAQVLQGLLGKDFQITVNVPDHPDPRVTVNVPEQKSPAPVVNVQPAEQKAPVVNNTINVPKAAPPNVNVKPAMVKVEPQITVEQNIAKSWNFTVFRDNRGLISNITAERND